MDNTFFLKLLLSFIIGAGWAIIVTVLADKYGSKIGGLISGLPSTGLFSLFFLAWTQGLQTTVSATTIIPAIIGVSNLFLLCYIFLVKKNFWLAIVSSLLVWFLLAFGLLALRFNNYFYSLILYLVSIVMSYLAIEYVWKIKTVQPKKIVYTAKNILLRGIISGSMVAFTVLMGKLGGAILGGVFSGFPAMFLSTIIITYFSHGPDFSASTMKSSVLGVISFVIHSIMVRYTYTPFGLVLGTVISVLVSFSSGFLIYKFIITRLR